MEGIYEGIYFGIAFLLGIICGAFCCYIAGEKNRSVGIWFVLGLFFNIIALIAICGVPVSTSKTP